MNKRLLILMFVVGAVLLGLSSTMGFHNGHSKGFKEGLDTVCSAEAVVPQQQAPVVEADPSLNQTLHFRLDTVSFNTKGYCTVSLFSIAKNRIGQNLANVGIRVPKKHCLTLPQRIGSQYRMVLTAEKSIPADDPKP